MLSDTYWVGGLGECMYPVIKICDASSTIVSKVVEGHKFRAVDIGEYAVGCSDGGRH